MTETEIANQLLFGYQSLPEDMIRSLASKLPKKMIRWLGIVHCDNRTRLIFLKMTGIVIGEETVINQNFIVSDNYESLLTIGKRVAVSPNVTVVCDSGANNSLLNENLYVKDHVIKTLPVVIEDDVWIGANVVILPGITIGAKSIIGAGSVVTKNVPVSTVVAGVPAKIIRKI